MVQFDGVPVGELLLTSPVGEPVQDIAVRLLGMLGLAPLVAEVLPELFDQCLHFLGGGCYGLFGLAVNGDGRIVPRTLNPRLSILFAGTLAAAVAGQACRYTVRDVGFVDLGNERYTFFCFIDDQVPGERVDQLGQAASVLFGDANVRFQLVDLAKGGHPQAKRLAKRKPGVPAGLLLSPNGELARTVNFPSAAPDNPEWAFLSAVVSSPVRDELIKKMIPAYAVILFVEGTDATQTKRARVAVDGAVKAITPLLPEMPKPVDHPPEVVVVSAEQVADESVLLWSLGLDAGPVSEPQAVVLMGRGRRVGQPLRGGLVSRSELQEALAVVGQDCECGLDRVWMQGERFPLAWGRAERTAAYAALGFDPDNPQVKGEISRIISRGPNSQPSGTASSNHFEQLSLGYSEEVIEFNIEPEELREPEPEPIVLAKQVEQVEQVEQEPTSLGQTHTMTWTLGILAVVALVGGGFLFLRRSGN